jgi:hypothetical protein
MDNLFYTYAYLREDRTPYYIGKGSGNRAYSKCGRTVGLPPRDRIIFLKTGLTEEEAFRHEIYMIAVFGRKDLGTGILWNFTDGGDGAANPSKETREKLSRASSNISEETRQKLREASSGRRHTPETIEKIRQANTGRKYPGQKKRSEETREKIRLAKTGLKHTPEAREKMRQAHLGQSPSLEQREKLSAANKGKPWSEKRWEAHRRWQEKRAEGG